MKLDHKLIEEYNYLVTRIANDYNRKYKMVSRTHFQRASQPIQGTLSTLDMASWS